MWKYREQVSFGVSMTVLSKLLYAVQFRLAVSAALSLAAWLQLSEEQYMERLDGVAGALR